MGLWFLATLMFTIFSGLYFAYDPQRLSPSEDKTSQVAGLFDSCRKGASLQAVTYPALGSLAPITMSCSASTGNLTAAAAQGLNVPGIEILVQPATLLNPGMAGRVVVTFIRPGATVMYSIPQLKAKKQIIDTFRREVNTGGVEEDNPPSALYRVIRNGSSEVARVPGGILGVPAGSVASLEIIN